MAIDVDEARFQQIAQVVLPGDRLDPDQANAIIQVARLAASADLEQAPEERSLLRQLTAHICAHAGVPPSRVPSISPLPLDVEERAARLASVTGHLVTIGARELAFVVAYLLTVADLELAPVETAFLEDLQRAIGVDDSRATDLVVAVSEIVTPGEPTPEALGDDETHAGLTS